FKNALSQDDFAVGDYQVGRITGIPSINFGYPVKDAAGATVAVVFAALDLKWFKTLAGQISLPAHSSVTLLDRHGQVLSHFPEGSVKNTSAKGNWSRVFPEVLDKEEGMLRLVDAAGEPVLVGFARMQIET